MAWAIGRESQCVVRNLTHGIDKTGEILEHEPEKMLVVKMTESSTLSMPYIKSTKMYQCVLGKNVFVSLGPVFVSLKPDWRIDKEQGNKEDER